MCVEQFCTGVTQDYTYFYDYLNEHTGRVTYAQTMDDARLDHSYEIRPSGPAGFCLHGRDEAPKFANP